MSITHTIIRYVSCALLIGTLVACSEPEQPENKPKAVKIYSSSDYVKSLAFTQISGEDSKSDRDAISAYAKQKARKSESQTLLVLEYEIEEVSRMQKIAAPVTLSKKASFSELGEIMKRLEKKKYTLHNMQLMSAKIATGKTLKLPEKDNDKIVAALQSQEHALLVGSKPLSALDTVKGQLKLIAFFTEKRMRDAAYIAADNAKQSLASLPKNQAKDPAIVEPLIAELDKLENNLQKVMPYTL